MANDKEEKKTENTKKTASQDKKDASSSQDKKDASSSQDKKDAGSSQDKSKSVNKLKKKAPSQEPQPQEPQPQEEERQEGPAFTAPSPPSVEIPNELIFFTGIALVIVAGLTSGQFKSWWDMVWNGNTANINKDDVFLLVGEIAFVFILSFIAELSAEGSQLALSLIGGLWLVWSIENTKKINAFVTAVLGTASKKGK